MVACSGHILESTKGIEIKLGTYIYVNERKCRRQKHNPILHFTWDISPYLFILKVVFYYNSSFLEFWVV